MNTESVRGSTPGQRILLTALGTRSEPAGYRLGDRVARRRLAPVALADLLEEPIDRVLAVCTEEARRRTGPELRDAFDVRELPVEVIDVPDATTSDELTRFVETVARAVTAHCLQGRETALVVDITHGFRHHAVLLYAVSLYLSSLDRLTVEQVWYAPLSTEGDAEILDLRPLLLLPQLVHAVHELRETGNARSLSRILGVASRGGDEMGRDLGALTRALLAGLPIEAGLAAGRVLSAGGRKGDPVPGGRMLRRAMQEVGVPLGGELWSDIEELLTPIAVEPGEKSAVALDEHELRRQAVLVTRLVEWEAVHTVVGLLREWTVSWALWSRDGDLPGGGWLDRHRRQPVERALNRLRMFLDDPELRDLLGDQQRVLATFWKNLTELRNAYMHFGMQRGLVDAAQRVGGSNLHRAWDYVRGHWRTITSSDALPSADLGTGDRGRVLVTPVGLSPGVLTNAVRNARAVGFEPDLIVIICSPQSQPMCDDALAHAGWDGQVVYRELEDAFATAGDMRPRDQRPLPNDPELRRVLATSSEVLVNLTGGTTAMSVIALQLADAARAYDRPVRRLLLVDRRAAEQQRDDPWAECEAVLLDEAEERITREL